MSRKEGGGERRMRELREIEALVRTKSVANLVRPLERR